jgi:predicted transcriptional regulator of viral defense system
MSNKSRFVIAENNIRKFFKQNIKKVFSEAELNGVFEEKRTIWNLPVNYSSNKFIEQLINRQILKNIEILFDSYVGKKQCFITEDATEMEIAHSLMNKSYLSHFSAVYLNGLTTQVPKTIYITFEQSKKNDINRTLKQEAIDEAFNKPQRKASSKAIYNEHTFIILNGMFTNRLGVYSLDNIPVTNIERTLIDIAVRPSYAGGVYSVLETYKNAITKISINKLIATLDNMNFIYPYHQSIGFYLERAGYDGKRLEDLRKRKKEFNFYLTYEMIEKDYSNDWKLYFPKGM